MTWNKVAIMAILGLFFGNVPGMLILGGIGLYLLDKQDK